MRGRAITLPLPQSAPPLAGVHAESGHEAELSRVTVLIGDLQLDVGVPAEMPAAAAAEDVIRLANTALAAQERGPDVGFDTTAGNWTLARIGEQPFDPDRPLAYCDVCDGDVLVIRDTVTPCAPMLFDDLDADGDSPGRRTEPGWTAATAMTAWFLVGLIASAGSALLLARTSPPLPAAQAALALGILGAVAACLAGRGRATGPASPWLVAAAIPLLVAGVVHAVPGASAVDALPLACAVTGCGALAALLTSRHGRAFHTAVLGVCLLGGGATLSVLLWAPPARTIGAILATVSVVVVYIAPRVTILLSKLPIPPVPTAGEPLDDIETQGGTTVDGVNAIGKQVIPTEEGMVERVRPSNQYLTGLIAAAAACAVAGSYLAIDVSNGFFWQGTVFAIAVACVLCLRGRSHHDLAQSAILIGCGLLTGLALIAKTATGLDGWQVNAALALVAVVVLVVACGLVAPQRTFSPVMKRYVEIFEFLAIALLFPLCLWIIRLYAFFRELRV